MNCISVSSSAGSGMLLMSATFTHSAPASYRPVDFVECRLFVSAQRGGIRPPSINSAMTYLLNSRSRRFPRISCCCLVQCLGEVCKNVVDVLDTHAEPNHFRSHTHFLLFLRGELTMRGGCGMTGQRFSVAHVDHSFKQAQGVETLCPRLEAAFHSKRQERAALGAQVALSHGIQGIVRESRIVDPFDHAMAAQKFRNFAGVLDMALDAKRKRLDSLQQEKTVEGR